MADPTAIEGPAPELRIYGRPLPFNASTVTVPADGSSTEVR